MNKKRIDPSGWTAEKERILTRNAPYGTVTADSFTFGCYDVEIRRIKEEEMLYAMVKNNGTENIRFIPEAEYDKETQELTLRIPELQYASDWLSDIAREADALIALQHTINEHAAQLIGGDR